MPTPPAGGSTSTHIGMYQRVDRREGKACSLQAICPHHASLAFSLWHRRSWKLPWDLSAAWSFWRDSECMFSRFQLKPIGMLAMKPRPSAGAVVTEHLPGFLVVCSRIWSHKQMRQTPSGGDEKERLQQCQGGFHSVASGAKNLNRICADVNSLFASSKSNFCFWGLFCFCQELSKMPYEKTD